MTEKPVPCFPGWVVLDRCGRHFGVVLNFLRDGSVPLPDECRELDEVLKEAQYYQIQGLVQHCISAMQVRRLQTKKFNVFEQNEAKKIYK